MNTEKVYHNLMGEERSIWQMVREEPYWAANRVQKGEDAIEQLKQCQSENAMLHKDNLRILEDLKKLKDELADGGVLILD